MSRVSESEGEEAAHDEPRRLARWLREEIGVQGPRRIVTSGPDRIRVSKIPTGLALELHRILQGVPELADRSAMAVAFRARAGAGPPHEPRSQCWHAAVLGILERAVERSGLQRERLDDLRAGVDSVFAILDACLFTQPLVSDRDWAPSRAERRALLDAARDLDRNDGALSRVYGIFEGRPVVNHCPGAALARRMLRNAWSVCCTYAG